MRSKNVVSIDRHDRLAAETAVCRLNHKQARVRTTPLPKRHVRRRWLQRSDGVGKGLRSAGTWENSLALGVQIPKLTILKQLLALALPERTRSASRAQIITKKKVNHDSVFTIFQNLNSPTPSNWALVRPAGSTDKLRRFLGTHSRAAQCIFQILPYRRSVWLQRTSMTSSALAKI